MTRIHILGAPVDNVSMDEAVASIKRMIADGGQHHVATPNPEMLVRAQSDTAFMQVLNHTALNIPDGAGLLWAAKRSGSPLKGRVTGTDLVENICAENLGSVFFLGAADGIALHAAFELQKKYPSLQIAGTFVGSADTSEEESIIMRINESEACILLVAFGAPKQELWIARNLQKLSTVKIAIGIGGAFDFFAGKRKRAPLIMQKLHLEWLWRLIIEPRRIGRIWNAVVVFPLLVLRKTKR